MTSTTVKKALIIGINYRNTSAELQGCINDAKNLRQFLIDKNYFTSSEIYLMDDSQRLWKRPTKLNIMRQLAELVKFANKNKTKQVELFLSYSGHGSNVLDRNGDEADSLDEVIVPCDYRIFGVIKDDDLKKYFINQLGSNVKLTVLCDSCNSGTILDLKYNPLSENDVPAENASDSKCDVMCISGCRDDQTSADAFIDNKFQGAMTASFIQAYTDGISYNSLITNMRSWLVANEYTQVPQLSSGKPINLDDQVMLSAYDD